MCHGLRGHHNTALSFGSRLASGAPPWNLMGSSDDLRLPIFPPCIVPESHGSDRRAWQPPRCASGARAIDRATQAPFLCLGTCNLRLCNLRTSIRHATGGWPSTRTGATQIRFCKLAAGRRIRTLLGSPGNPAVGAPAISEPAAPPQQAQPRTSQPPLR